ncbi:hypothetical protein EV641_105172 [Rhodococcus sp. SMB37]|uniref:hypothetical protein n=1 Tax=Rhodococcus sp. SMB37 TaxID=2512213 RepID=UPI00104F39B6|nr:hypothetical protein [Rhodococcus sp. SMB37]TCN54147.1 hypothetical protein EV641_105172 [Rhodococcus sp. SMB37]
MTDGKSTDTGQISVAELLARNGKKVGSRSGGRRRRGTTGGISVAELTGEIPITRVPAEPEPAAKPEPRSGSVVDDRSPQTPAVATPRTPKVEPAVPETPQVEPVVPETPKVATPTLSTPAPPSANELTTISPKAAGPKVADTDATTVTPAVVESTTAKSAGRKPAVGKSSTGKAAFGKGTVADRPTTVSDGAKVESPTEIIRPEALPRRARAHLDNVAGPVPTVSPASPSSRASDVPEPRLLSGPASDLQGTGADDDDGDTDTIGITKDEDGGKASSKSKSSSKGKAAPSKGSAKSKTGSSGKAASKDEAGSSGASSKSSSGKGKPDTTTDDSVDGSGGSAKQWMLLIGESVAAIVVGGLLFKGFEKLWDMMPWVAFGLALLVIVGLVALVRVLRRTDDITSQLIAVGVGAFVAFGPLLFLLPNG